MKTLYATIILLAMVLAIAAQETSDLREADKLSKEVVSLFREKKFKEALPIALKVVELEEKESGYNSVKFAQSLRNLGYVYLYLNQELDATLKFETAIDILEKIPNLDAESNKLAGNMAESLALIKYRQKNISEAEEFFKKAAALYGKNGDLYWLEISKIWLILGNLKTSLRSYAEAAQYYEKALALRIEKLDDRDTDTVDALNRSVCSYKKANKEKEIERVRTQYYPDGKFSKTGFLKSKADSETDKNSETKKKKTTTDKNSTTGTSLTEPLESGVVNGKAISLPRPAYPIEARREGAFGKVEISVVVGETGEILFACGAFSKAHPLLIEAAEAAAYGAKFQPTTLDGKPIKVIGIIIYNFNR